MIDFFIILIVVAIVGGAIAYIVHEKKAGAHCIGCPHSRECSKRGNCKHHK